MHLLRFMEPPRVHLAARRDPPGLLMTASVLASRRLAGSRIEVAFSVRARQGCGIRIPEVRSRGSRRVPEGGGPVRNLRVFVALADLGAMARRNRLELLGRVDLLARGAVQDRWGLEFRSPLEAPGVQELPAMEGHCPVCCQEHEGPVVACPFCETGLHPECWEYLGGCATYACRGAAGAPG